MSAEILKNINNLCLDTPSRIWVRKLAYDWRNHRLPVGVFYEFLARLNTELRGCSVDMPGLLEKLRDILDGDKNGKRFFLTGCCKPGRKLEYSRVMTRRSFITHNVISEERGQEAEERFWKAHRTLKPFSFAGGEMKTQRDYFWGVPRQDLVDLMKIPGPESKKAELIRNRLGLTTVGKRAHLLRIDIPCEVLENKKVRAPTILDANLEGGQSLLAFTPGNDPEFGWTCDLVDLKPGAREVVVEKLEFNHKYKIVRIGTVENEPPKIPVDDYLKQWRRMAL